MISPRQKWFRLILLVLLLGISLIWAVFGVDMTLHDSMGTSRNTRIFGMIWGFGWALFPVVLCLSALYDTWKGDSILPPPHSSGDFPDSK